MTRNHKSHKMFHRLSRIFHHTKEEDSVTIEQEKPSLPTYYNNNTSLPILLQRAPSSKLLIDDDSMDVSRIEYSHSYSDIHEEVHQFPKRQSWFTTIRTKTLKGKKSSKRLSHECWFIHPQQQEEGGLSSSIIEQQQIPDLPQKKEGEGVIISNNSIIIEEEIKRMEIPSPLSFTSSIHSSSTQHYNTNNRHHLSSSSSFWLTIEENDGLSTARTSIDSSHIKELPKSSSIHLAEHVKNILGDAILLADQELNI